MTKLKPMTIELDDEQVHDIALKHLIQTYQIHYDFENDLEEPELDFALRKTISYFTTPTQFVEIIKQIESTRKTT